jgi:hypothetical protein
MCAQLELRRGTASPVMGLKLLPFDESARAL